MDLLRFLLEQKELKPTHLADVLGSRGGVSEILSGKRVISKERLGEFFHVSPVLFI